MFAHTLKHVLLLAWAASAMRKTTSVRTENAEGNFGNVEGDFGNARVTQLHDGEEEIWTKASDASAIRLMSAEFDEYLMPSELDITHGGAVRGVFISPLNHEKLRTREGRFLGEQKSLFKIEQATDKHIRIRSVVFEEEYLMASETNSFSRRKVFVGPLNDKNARIPPTQKSLFEIEQATDKAIRIRSVVFKEMYLMVDRDRKHGYQRSLFVAPLDHRSTQKSIFQIKPVDEAVRRQLELALQETRQATWCDYWTHQLNKCYAWLAAPPQWRWIAVLACRDGVEQCCYCLKEHHCNMDDDIEKKCKDYSLLQISSNATASCSRRMY